MNSGLCTNPDCHHLPIISFTSKATCTITCECGTHKQMNVVDYVYNVLTTPYNENKFYEVCNYDGRHSDMKVRAVKKCKKCYLNMCEICLADHDEEFLSKKEEHECEKCESQILNEMKCDVHINENMRGCYYCENCKKEECGLCAEFCKETNKHNVVECKNENFLKKSTCGFIWTQIQSAFSYIDLMDRIVDEVCRREPQYRNVISDEMQKYFDVNRALIQLLAIYVNCYEINQNNVPINKTILNLANFAFYDISQISTSQDLLYILQNTQILQINKQRFNIDAYEYKQLLHKSDIAIDEQNEYRCLCLDHNKLLCINDNTNEVNIYIPSKCKLNVPSEHSIYDAVILGNEEQLLLTHSVNNNEYPLILWERNGNDWKMKEVILKSNNVHKLIKISQMMIVIIIEGTFYIYNMDGIIKVNERKIYDNNDFKIWINANLKEALLYKNNDIPKIISLETLTEKQICISINDIQPLINGKYFYYNNTLNTIGVKNENILTIFEWNSFKLKFSYSLPSIYPDNGTFIYDSSYFYMQTTSNIIHPFNLNANILIQPQSNFPQGTQILSIPFNSTSFYIKNKNTFSLYEPS